MVATDDVDESCGHRVRATRRSYSVIARGGGHRAGREVASMPKKDKEGKKDIKKGKEVDKG